MPITTLLIDLDDTVYPNSLGLWDAIRARMDLYLEVRMGFPKETIPTMRHDLFTKYGTTLRGLQAVYHVDEHDFLAFVHDLPIPSFLSPNPILAGVLHSLPHPKYIFTNSDIHHANRVMVTLGIQDCFLGVIDIFVISPYCKPMPESFAIALSKAGKPDPSSCLFVDDTIANLDSAKRVGLHTLHVHDNGLPSNGHKHIPLLESLPEALQQIEEAM